MTAPGDAGASASAAPVPEALPETSCGERARRVSLVIQTSFLGDTVLTTPLIAELASRGPVDVVVTPAAAPILRNNPAIRELLLYDKRGDARGMTGLWRTSRTLITRCPPTSTDRGRRCIDAAYMAQGSVRSAALAMLAGIPERVGFATSPARHLYTRRVPFDDDQHHAERLWRLAVGPDHPQPSSEAIRPRLFPGDDDRVAVEVLLAEHGWDGEPFIALAPGSVWATKRWPWFSELARLVVPRMRVAIIGGPGDLAEARSITDALGPAHRPIDAVGRLTLLGSAALLGRAAALVTNDSSPLHLASAMGTPTVAVFGPTVPEFGFGPLASMNAVAGHDGLSCRPCDRHGPRRCPLGHWRCMLELTPASIDELLRRILSLP
ncbi:MAG TPA: glycosyltransferase family 9 protein [Gemmatimonadaceae bacterium]|nr:glycosyltransferase family 9 protein [Gemmatimonadaceae bacterium]